ncbi:DUF3006 domain-containing protein [Clostridium uliginosum]|uniref:DUF3006 domain-containing protein n=1 Tax=Clostridium uliginosum TaxID=119641 RepID=A0A1I1PG57_9CLOT|nr:DUF3006 domain-containing protein [Clostridium uliginosum]SFD08696.1 Protein of unknown function [Clostridium uliginosum]
MGNKYIIDRIEGMYAILECYNGDMLRISVSEIKGTPKEGDILINKGDTFIVDNDLTINRKDKTHDMMKNMWK